MAIKPRPKAWISGPDPIRHAKYKCWQQQKNQAIWRKEPYDLTFDQYVDLWGNKFDQRGRHSDQYCMWRANPALPWTLTNVRITTRNLQGSIAAYRKMANSDYVPRKPIPAMPGVVI